MRPNGPTGADLRNVSSSEVALSVEFIALSPVEAMSTLYGCGSAARAGDPVEQHEPDQQ